MPAHADVSTRQRESSCARIAHGTTARPLRFRWQRVRAVDSCDLLAVLGAPAPVHTSEGGIFPLQRRASAHRLEPLGRS